MSPRSTQLSASASGLLVWVIMAADEGVIGAFQRFEQGHGGGRVLEVGQRMDRVRNRCSGSVSARPSIGDSRPHLHGPLLKPIAKWQQRHRLHIVTLPVEPLQHGIQCLAVAAAFDMRIGTVAHGVDFLRQRL